MTSMKKITGLFTGLLSGAMALCLCACQPTYNWREVRFEGTQVQAQLPCKPDRTQREVTMAQAPVRLQVAGCAVGDGLWVVTTGRIPATADTAHVLKGWQEATWRTLQASTPETQPWSAAKALPGAVRVRAQGVQPNGQATQVQGLWVAWPEGDGVQWLNAMVYQPHIPVEMADTFFESIRQP